MNAFRLALLSFATLLALGATPAGAAPPSLSGTVEVNLRSATGKLLAPVDIDVAPDGTIGLLLAERRYRNSGEGAGTIDQRLWVSERSGSKFSRPRRVSSSPTRLRGLEAIRADGNSGWFIRSETLPAGARYAARPRAGRGDLGSGRTVVDAFPNKTVDVIDRAGRVTRIVKGGSQNQESLLLPNGDIWWVESTFSQATGENSRRVVRVPAGSIVPTVVPVDAGRLTRIGNRVSIIGETGTQTDSFPDRYLIRDALGAPEVREPLPASVRGEPADGTNSFFVLQQSPDSDPLQPVDIFSRTGYQRVTLVRPSAVIGTITRYPTMAALGKPDLRSYTVQSKSNARVEGIASQGVLWCRPGSCSFHEVFRRTATSRYATRSPVGSSNGDGAVVLWSERQRRNSVRPGDRFIRTFLRPLQPTPAAQAAPQQGKTVGAGPVSGRILVKAPGRGFRLLRRGERLRVGTVVDATAGRVRLSAADGEGGLQTAVFYSGRFRLTQAKGSPLVTLKLVESLDCSTPKARIRAARKARTRKKRRRLWGDGSGRFRTSGKHGTATVQGTKWLVEDRCTGTLVRVARGRVSVRDLRRARTLKLTAGRQVFLPADRRRKPVRRRAP